MRIVSIVMDPYSIDKASYRIDLMREMWICMRVIVSLL